MSNGAIARVCEFRRIGHQPAECFRIFGTKGSFDPELYRDPLPEPLASNLGGHGGSHAYLVHEFIDSIVHDRHPYINAWEAAWYFAPGLVAHQSALKDGELLKIPDWGDASER